MSHNMTSDNSGDITQKDLLKLLFDQAQHNATREEVNALEVSLTQRIDKLEDKFEKKFERLNWLLITTLVGVIASLALQLLK